MEILGAFADRPYPGDHDITHCPCPECDDIAACFRGKPWQDVVARDLRSGAPAHLFTVRAYCYYLPAYLRAAIEDPEELDAGVEHLPWIFGSSREDGHRFERAQAVVRALAVPEWRALLRFFTQMGPGLYFDEGATSRAAELIGGRARASLGGGRVAAHGGQISGTSRIAMP